MNAPFELPTVVKVPLPAGHPYAPKAVACIRQGGCDTEDICETYGDCKVSRTSVELDRLAELATILRTLTYGEMVELVGGLWSISDGKITDGSLAAILHAWSKSR